MAGASRMSIAIPYGYVFIFQAQINGRGQCDLTRPLRHGQRFGFIISKTGWRQANGKAKGSIPMKPTTHHAIESYGAVCANRPIRWPINNN